MNENIFPDSTLGASRDEQETKLGQKGHLIWFYGLSGAGKSTLARALNQHLRAQGLYTVLLDGDNLRGGLNNNLGFSDEDRLENIRRTAEVAKLFVENGALVLGSFITPTRVLRDLVRSIIPADDLTMVFVGASFETCRNRDVKGLYAKAARGEIKAFTGKDSAFEEPAPEDNEIRVLTDDEDVDQTLKALLNQLDTNCFLPRKSLKS